MAATVAGILLTGNHASRPTTGLQAGTLYSCTTHSLIYQTSDTGASWSTWANLSGTGAVATDTIWDAKGDLVAATGADTAAKLTVGSNGLLLAAASGASNGLAWGTPAWTTYTPTWAGASGNPSLGDGSLNAAYYIAGKLYAFRISLVMGSSTTYGSGRWSFTLGGGVSAIGQTQVVSCYLLDNSVTAARGIAAWVSTGASPVVRPVGHDGAINGISSTVPWTWAQNDQLHITGVIEIA